MKRPARTIRPLPMTGPFTVFCLSCNKALKTTGTADHARAIAFNHANAKYHKVCYGQGPLDRSTVTDTALKPEKRRAK
jgi:hypothetical protein